MHNSKPISTADKKNHRLSLQDSLKTPKEQKQMAHIL